MPWINRTPDWRRFRDVHKKLLERYCSQVLEEMAAASRSSHSSAHDLHLEVYRLIHERDKQIANVFDDFRRSRAVMQLAIMRRLNLLTDEELSLFSEQTRRQVEGIASL